MKNKVLPTSSKLVLAALAGAMLLASLGISIATVALPTLARVFSATVQQVQWVVLGYLLAVTVAIVSAGRMGDLYGHRRVLVAGLALFTVASFLCAAADDLSVLIAGRVAQGLGAAILMSLPMSIAKGLVARERIGSAMGLLGTMSAIGTALGPSVGGLLIGQRGWRSAFVLLAVSGAGVLVLALRAIPAAPPRRGPRVGGMDWLGSLWLSVTLICFALAATGGKVGFDIPSWLLLALAALALWAFIHTEVRTASPLVPVGLVGGRAVGTALAMNLLVGAIMMSTLVVGPFFLTFGLGLDEARMGMVMAVGPMAAALSGVPAGRITDRFGVHRTLLAGLGLATASLCCFALLPALWGVPGYVMALVLLTPGFQLFLAANNAGVMLDASDEQRGMASGLLGLSRNLGFMAGASLLPMLFTVALGDQGVDGSAPQEVGEAFSLTFLATAGLCVLAILLALWGKRRQRSTSFVCSKQSNS